MPFQGELWIALCGGIVLGRGNRCEKKTVKKTKKLLNDLQDRRRYSHLKEEAVDRSIRRDRLGKRR
jgi:hypothetical protein